MIHILHSPEDFAKARALIASGEDVTQNKPRIVTNHSRDVTPTPTQTQAERERETRRKRVREGNIHVVMSAVDFSMKKNNPLQYL